MYGYPYQNYYQQPQQNWYQQQNQFVQQPAYLSGQVVDSIDVVRAKDVDLSGNPTYYPNVNRSEIYVKQLSGDGTSKITTYKIVDNVVTQKESISNAVTVEDFNKAITNIMNEITDLKHLIAKPSFQEGDD